MEKVTKSSKGVSVVLAVYNEEKNLPLCLSSVNEWADEIVVVDGGSADKTVSVARSFGAKVIQSDNPAVFHINKQKALDSAKKEWIFQLDADEVVTAQLATEIQQVTKMSPSQIDRRSVDPARRRLFKRHQELIEQRDGPFGEDTDEIAAFFVPRRNYFLGKPIRYAGTYPDGVIRLVKKGKARFPCKSVHEQIRIDGRVDWLYNDLLHYSNPTISAYLANARRYVALVTDELSEKKERITPMFAIRFLLLYPVGTFVLLYFRHKGFLDGIRGLVFSFLSALHFPYAFFAYTSKR